MGKCSTALVLVLLCGYAAAQGTYSFDIVASRCARGDDHVIETITGVITDIDNLFPNVPPEERAYLEAENKAALALSAADAKRGEKLSPRSVQRWTHLTQRPLYRVWQYRETSDKLRQGLGRITKVDEAPKTFYRYPEAEKLQRATTLVSVFVDYFAALEELKRAPQSDTWLTPEDHGRLIAQKSLVTSKFEDYLSCKIGKIMGNDAYGIK